MSAHDSRTTHAAPARPQTLADIADSCPSLPSPPAAFEQPWQATLVAMTVHLQERGHFSWELWARTLGAHLRRTQAPQMGAGPTTSEVGGFDAVGYAAGYDAAGYYEAWADALVDVLARSGALEAAAVEATQRRWLEAAARTPHGRPVTLS